MTGHLKTLAKTISWRVLGAIDTFALSFLVTGSVTSAGAVVGFEILTKSCLYYGHEMAWTKVFTKVWK